MGTLRTIATPDYSIMQLDGETDSEFALKWLRTKRNQLLDKTDWWCLSDRSPTQAQLDYRQALRDLPATASSSLDENGNLTGVTWPTKPE